MTGWPQKPSTLFLYEKLLASYRLCVRGKPELKSTAWHWCFEKELSKLAFDLNCKTYKPGLSNIFVVKVPKPREVIAAHIRDRVVHRMLYEYMAPYWEKRFLPSSYACRRGMGPLAAVKAVERVVRCHGRATSRPLYALKVDVSRFFPSMCHDVLLGYLRQHLENPFFVWLTELIVRHRATDPGQYRLHSPRSDWRLVEPAKSLFGAPRSRGLPIGNLTSQFFANVYMHPFDVWLASRRKGQFLYAQRYVDDVLVVGEDKAVLAALVPAMQDFVQKNLKLSLNPKNTVLRPVAHGIDHLGYFIKPSHTTVCRSVKRRAERRLRDGAFSDERMVASVQAALGHATHGKNERWRRSLVNTLRAERPGVSHVACLRSRTLVEARAPRCFVVLEEALGALP
jgi:hypothetical protein